MIPISSMADITWPIGFSIQYAPGFTIYSMVRSSDLVGLQFRVNFSDVHTVQYRTRWTSIDEWKTIAIK